MACFVDPLVPDPGVATRGRREPVEQERAPTAGYVWQEVREVCECTGLQQRHGRALDERSAAS